MRTIKKTLSQNKESWDSRLKYALLVDRISSKKSTGMSPFQPVYDADVILPIQLGLPVMELLQDIEEEPNDLQRRMNQLIEVQQTREHVNDKCQSYQDKIKTIFERKAKDRNFVPGDLVLKWDVMKQDHGKHGKFDNLWLDLSKLQ